MPVSPVTLFNVRDVELPEGGTIVQATTVEPPVGSVMVFAPLAKVFSSTDAGELEFDPADNVSTPVTSPVYVMMTDRVAVAAK